MTSRWPTPTWWPGPDTVVIYWVDERVTSPR
jgi:hypothetical protein